ncbi:MAG: helix-turn-helix transcriptional regulator [Oscillospiraceae bacterium]|nr:helix-turn-helix transcriptional regulator [Oscillospiraceae bacterium]
MKNRIKDLREDHDLSQKVVAKAIGITQRKYSYLETGTQQFTDEILDKLADYYGVSVDYLLFRTNNPEPYKK